MVRGIDGATVLPSRNVLRAVESSIAAAEHLTDADEGAVSSALSFASRIQEALDSGDEGRADKLMYGPYSSLGKILNDLGLTPQGRANLGLDADAEVEEEDF